MQNPKSNAIRSLLCGEPCLFCRMCFRFVLNANSHKIPVKKNHPSTHMEAVSAPVIVCKGQESESTAPNIGADEWRMWEKRQLKGENHCL